MNPETIETSLHWFGGLTAWATLGVVLYGIWRGTRRPAGRTTGRAAGWLRSPLFYLCATALFVGSSVALWRPLPLVLSIQARAWMLALGSLAYFPGLAFFLWGRLALGKMYFVSTGFGAQLFASHQLVTHGPFAIVRHPMYLGLIAAAFGSLLIYQTWTTVLFAFFAPFILRRARREEQALAAEFGEEWQAYAANVPMFLPRWKKKSKESNQ
ncbi:MAG: isoprenylcysteine carboxylmethyltransferase family protein [Chloroflexi bacterium]|nr:isoprenylcysteine carboxylmethyltransferase family protein [Chloroflexota bacterium]MBI3338988.1 isoprenylcysteine carboxylmethyltransferase family protein [Chloroflexota bacterium]